jgi:hypothetical protein
MCQGMMGRGHGGQERELLVRLLVHGSHDGYFNIKTFRKLLKGGQGGATADTRVLLTTQVGRAGAVPLATQGYPTTEGGRE